MDLRSLAGYLRENGTAPPCASPIRDLRSAICNPASFLLGVLLVLAAVVLSGCGGGGGGGGGGISGGGSGLLQTLHVSAKIQESGSAGDRVLPLVVADVNALRLTIFNSAGRGSGVLFTQDLGVGATPSSNEFSLSGVTAGTYLITMGALDSTGTLLEETGCFFPLGPGLTASLDVTVSPAGVAMAGAGSECSQDPSAPTPELIVEVFDLESELSTPGSTVPAGMIVRNDGIVLAQDVVPDVQILRDGVDVSSEFTIGQTAPPVLLPAKWVGGWFKSAPSARAVLKVDPFTPIDIPPSRRASFFIGIQVNHNAASGGLAVRARARPTSGTSDPRTTSVPAVLAVTPPAVPGFAGGLRAPALVSTGRTVVASFTLTNTGETDARFGTAALSLGAGLTATLRSAPGTPIPSGGTLDILFDVTASASAAAGPRPVEAMVSVTEAITRTPRTTSSVLGSITVTRSAALVLSSAPLAAEIVQGQVSSFSFALRNTGGTSAVGLTPSLSFDDSTGLSTSLASGPSRLAPGAAGTLTFGVTAAAGAPATVRNLHLTVAAGDERTGAGAGFTSTPAGTLTVLSRADVSAISPLEIPGFTTPGGTLRGSVSIHNTGQSTASVSLVSLVFDDPGDLTVTPVGAPSSIAGGAVATYTFDVAVGATASATTRTADVQVTATDAATGASVDSSRAGAGSFTIVNPLSPAALELSGSLRSPTTVSQGQSFVASYTVRNTGQTTATIAGAGLSFSGSGVDAVARGNLPGEISGGATAPFAFDVTVSSSASTGPLTASVVVTASDALSGSDASLGATPAGTVTVQAAAALSLVGGLSAPALVSQGQSFVASYTVRNTGQTTATIAGAGLSFSGSGVDAVARGNLPGEISGGATAPFAFDVTVSSSASTGPLAASVVVTASDALSGSDASLGATPAGTVTVQAAAALAFSSGLLAPPVVTQGETFTAKYAVANSGETTAAVSQALLSFSGDGFTGMADGSNPTSIAGGQTSTFTFSVAVATTASTTLARIASAEVSAVDQLSGAGVGIFGTLAGSVSVQTGTTLRFDGGLRVPTSVSQGQTFVASFTLANDGESPANLNSAILSFEDPSLVVTADGGNPATLSGATTATFSYSVAVNASTTAGAKSAGAFVVASDSNTGLDASTSTLALGQVTVVTGASLAITGLTTPAAINPGTTATLAGTVFNSGGATASVTNVQMSFGNSGLSASPTFGIPFDVTSEVPLQLVFEVTASGSITPGTTSLALTLSGVDKVSGASLSAGPESDEIDVRTTATLLAPDLLLGAPLGIGQGDPSPSLISLSILNSDLAASPLRLGSVEIDFTTTSDGSVKGEYTVSSPSDLLTRSISAGKSTSFSFFVTASAVATAYTPVDILYRVQGVDTFNSTTSTQTVTTTWTVRQAADMVKGQMDFSSGSANRGTGVPGADTLATPARMATDGTRLVVCDTGNNRVLLFASLTDTSATTVLGQPNFTSSGPGSGAAGMDTPRGVAIVGDDLCVADTMNHRVLIFDDWLTAATGASANRVLGQADFTTNLPGMPISGSTLDTPEGLATDGSSLAVADRMNNRVLIFDNIAGIASGAGARAVVGQVDKISADTTQLSGPRSVAVTSDHLLVADTLQHRIQVYSSFSTLSDNPAATATIGQTGGGLSPNAGQASPNNKGFDTPLDLSLVGPHLAVAEEGNSRVLLFPDIKVSSLAASPAPTARDIFGHAGFSGRFPNDAVQGLLDKFALNQPRGVLGVEGGRTMFVSDTGNSRLLRFRIR